MPGQGHMGGRFAKPGDPDYVAPRPIKRPRRIPLLDFIAPRAHQSYVGPSTRFRVMPRQVDWFSVFIALLMLLLILAVIDAMTFNILITSDASK